jgi:hypothetical protein
MNMDQASTSFFKGDVNGRYSVHVCDEITGGDEDLLTNDISEANGRFEALVAAVYVTGVELVDLSDGSSLRSWSVDPNRTPQSALARNP